MSGAAVVWPPRIPFFWSWIRLDGDRDFLINQQRALGTDRVDIVRLAVVANCCTLRRTTLNDHFILARAVNGQGVGVGGQSKQACFVDYNTGRFSKIEIEVFDLVIPSAMFVRSTALVVASSSSTKKVPDVLPAASVEFTIN